MKTLADKRMAEMKLKLAMVLTLFAWGLSGCGGQDNSGTANLSGQVSALNAPAAPSHFAASRLLEQASMGPSPAMVAQVKSQGIDAWIASQMKMAPTKIVTPESMVNYDDQRDKPAADRMRDFYRLNLFNVLIGGEDQLRIRTSWVLSNFLVVSTRKVAEYGIPQSVADPCVGSIRRLAEEFNPKPCHG